VVFWRSIIAYIANRGTQNNVIAREFWSVWIGITFSEGTPNHTWCRSDRTLDVLSCCSYYKVSYVPPTI